MIPTWVGELGDEKDHIDWYKKNLSEDIIDTEYERFIWILADILEREYGCLFSDDGETMTEVSHGTNLKYVNDGIEIHTIYNATNILIYYKDRDVFRMDTGMGRSIDYSFVNHDNIFKKSWSS